VPPETAAPTRASPPGKPIDPRDEIRAVTRQLLDSLLPILALLGALVLVVAIWRTLRFGWQPLIGAYLLFFAVPVGVLWFQRRLPLELVALSICAVGLADGVVGLVFYGFASAGLLLLTVSAASVSVFLGLRAGLAAAGAGLLALLAIAGWWTTGSAPLGFDAEAYLRSPAGWTVQGVHFILLTLLLVVMIHAIQQGMSRSITAVQERTTALSLANRELEAEMRSRERTERELREREAQYRLLTEHMSEVLVQQDLNLAFVYVSPSVERMFGYTVEEALRLEMRQVMTPESLGTALSTFAAALERARHGPVEVPLLDFEYVRKDGSTFWGELAAKLLLDGSGQPIGSVGVLRDVTARRRAQEEQRRLEEQLRQAEKLQVLGQLAGGIAHDFNNQLAGIMGHAELLKLSEASPAVQDATQTILHCAQRARDLTAKLLVFARRTPRQTRLVDLHEIAREVASILERSIDKRVVLRLELGAPRPEVLGDATALQNALLNLALNARDAMPDGGVLTLRTEEVDGPRARELGGTSLPGDGAHLVVSVEDTGIGIAPEALPRLFEPFYTTKPVGEGTGLGLPAVHGTATAHQGAVGVRSRLGEGSVISLVLPLAAARPAPAMPPLPVTTPGPARVLVVDDEPAVGEVVRLALEHMGCQVTTATTGAEGVELFRVRRGQFDLVLLDLMLPGMSGAQVFRALRALDPVAPVLLMSGHSDEATEADLLAAGALRLLRKPFTLAELAAAVTAALAGAPRSPAPPAAASPG